MHKEMKLKYITLCLALIPVFGQGMDLTSEECRTLALQTDEQARMADNDVVAARYQRDVARTAYLPKFDGSVTGAWLWPDIAMSGGQMSIKGAYMAGITLQQPIFTGGKIYASNKLADIGRRSASEQRRLKRMQIVADADNAYWNYVSVQAKVNMAKAYLAQIDTAYNQTKIALEAGMVTQNDLLRVEARRSQVTYQLQQAEAGCELCRMAVCRTIGEPLDTPIATPDTEVAVVEPNLGDYTLADRPELQLLQQQVEATKQQVTVTRADYLPQLGLQIGWNAYGNMKMKGTAPGPDGNMYPYTQTIKDNMWMGMLSLKVPLWHWGEGYKKVKKAKLDVENARLDLERSRRMMELEVQQAITNVMTSHELIGTAELALSQAKASLGNMQQRYDVGMTSLTDLLDAQSQWQSAYSDLIEARAQYRMNITEYLRVTGRLPIE